MNKNPTQESEIAVEPKPSLEVLEFKNFNIAVGQIANTYRLGKKWSEKVKPGDAVSLSAGDKIVGKARVISVTAGPWSNMNVFASDNHAAAGRPAIEAQSILQDELEAVYPKVNFNEDVFSVIYFKRES